MSNQIIGPGLTEAGSSLFTSHPSGSFAYTLGTSVDGQIISLVRGPHTQLFYATCDGAGLNVFRHDDTFPEVAVSIVTVEAADTTSVCLLAHSSGILDLLYCHTSGAVKMRSSRDQGATWGSATTIIASGYKYLTAALDEESGLICLLAWKSSDTSWYSMAGTLDAAGTTWSFSSPAALVTSTAEARGQVRSCGNGRFQFAYVTSGGSVAILESPTFLTTGAGAWNTLSMTAISGYEQATFWPDGDHGFIPLFVYDSGTSKWSIRGGGLNAGGDAYTFAAAVDVATASSNSQADCLKDASGLWIFAHFPNSGGVAILRARSLKADGTGVFS